MILGKSGGSKSLFARILRNGSLTVMKMITVPSWVPTTYVTGSGNGNATTAETNGVEVAPMTGNAGSMNPYLTTNFVIKH